MRCSCLLLPAAFIDLLWISWNYSSELNLPSHFGDSLPMQTSYFPSHHPVLTLQAARNLCPKSFRTSFSSSWRVLGTQKAPTGYSEMTHVLLEVDYPSVLSWNLSRSPELMHACTVVFDSLWPHGLQPTTSSIQGICQARILGWAAMPSSRTSSWPRDWTSISCIGRLILYCWATREAQNSEWQNEVMKELGLGAKRPRF